jgi:S1-C subfamily serine protease
MRHILLSPLLLALVSCDPPAAGKAADLVTPPHEQAALSNTVPAPDVIRSVVRINATQQSWNPGQPWEKNPPQQRRALAAIVGTQQVLTTAELVADSTYLEFESPDGTLFAQARVIAVDYEANLALLGPANEAEGNALFDRTRPLEISEPPGIGDSLDILQIEDNGLTLLTTGTLRSIDISPNFLPDHAFLTFLVKASMQAATSSYSLPVLTNGKLAGVLTSYDAKDQICDITATDIVSRFVKESADGDYTGFPSLGISVARTEDPSFRQWLKLADDQGGIYVQKVRKGGAAELAGVLTGDVILAVDGQAINRRGYYEHPHYGNLIWGHLIRGEKAIGDVISLSIIRKGEPLEINATLTREEENARLVPGYSFGKAPNFLIKGGLLFQELSRTLLEAFGENWQSRAPLNFLDALENPEKYEGKVNRIVFLSASIPTPATIGYERLRNLIVRKVNGQEIKDIKSLIDAFESNPEDLHSIEFDEEQFTVYLDEAVSTAVDSQLLKSGITRLSRAE